MFLDRKHPRKLKFLSNKIEGTFVQLLNNHFRSIVKIMERSNIVSIGTIYEEIDLMEIPTSKNGQKRYIDHLSKGNCTSVLKLVHMAARPTSLISDNVRHT